jgi:1-deoxy-D-xylulose-5-phosphate reductoisomerase
MKGLSILGCTGSIGRNTLEIAAAFPDRFTVRALCAGKNVKLLAEQVRQFSPQTAVVMDETCARELNRRLDAGHAVDILYGAEGYREAATLSSVDTVVSAMVGAAGLMPTLAAIESGKTIALANKEVLVMAGDVVMPLAAAKGVPILPVDSEHSAIFQCLQGQDRRFLARIHLTASGGPFLNRSRAEIETAGPEDALSHPTWQMGKKISIDSATLMNKGLEVIEAAFLFDVPAADIDVVVHPQSVVHSLVSFIDGSMLAQLSLPDMKGAIAYALSYPERLAAVQPALDLAALGRMTFQRPDREKFPCLGLAFEAARQGGTLPAVLNAANEIAVTAFLEERIGFYRIPALIEDVMGRHKVVTAPALSDIIECDAWAREIARELVPV